MVDGARRGEKALEGLGRKGKTLGQTFDAINKKTGLLAKAFGALIALGVAKFFSDAVSAAGTFETKMAEISTLVDTAVFKIGLLEQAILDQSKAFGQSANQQGAAAYQIISAGASTATEAIDLLTASNKLAIGGVTDVATAADGLTSVLNAYGDKVEGATAVSDALFVGMRAGKTTIGQLAGSLGKVAPLAAQAGVGFDELVASVAALTKGGISTRESVTGVRAILAAVVKPTKEASDLAKELGLNFNAAALESQGFAGFMEQVVEKTGGSSDAMAKLFGGVEALIPALALAGQAGVDFRDIMADMAEKGGATQEAFEKMTNTFEFQSARLRESLNVSLIKLGSIITTILTPAVRFLADNFDTITRFIIAAAAGFAVTLIPAVLAAIPAIATMTSGLIAMAAAWLLTPFGQIAALILAASAALAYFGDVSIKVGDINTTVWQAFIAGIGVAWDLLKEGVAIVADVFGKAASAAGGFFTTVINWLGGFFNDWSSTFTSIGEFIKSAINTWIGLHVGFVKAAGKVITTGIPAAFKLAMGAAKNAVITGLQFILDAVVNALGGVGDALAYIPGVADDLGAKIRSSLDVDLSGLRSDTQALTADFQAAGSAIGTTFTDAVNNDYVGQLGDAIGSVGDTLKDRLVERLATTNEELAAAQDSSAALAETTTSTVVPALDSVAGSAGGAAKAMKDLNKERMDFIESIDTEFARIQEANGGAVAAVEAWYQDQKAKLADLGLEYTDYADKLETIFTERLSDAYQTDLDNATDWRSGIERAVQGLGESIGNEADLAEAALTSLFNNAADAIVEFAMTGKFNFRDFAASVAKDILTLTTKMLLFKALKGSLGLFSEGGLVGGGALGFATGGFVSGPGGPKSDSIPAMLSNGEFVVNASATKDFLPLLNAMNSGNMDMVGLASGGLSNDNSSLPAQPEATASTMQVNKQGDTSQGGSNITIIPTINPSDIVDTFDSDDGDRVLVNMLERNKTTIKGILK